MSAVIGELSGAQKAFDDVGCGIESAGDGEPGGQAHEEAEGMTTVRCSTAR
jgi:hypothetical protein